MNIIYEDTDWALVLEELKLLFPEHCDELCVVKEFPLLPDYEAYETLRKLNMLRCITCRADGKLIGYITFMIQPHLHYRTCKTAIEDMYFIKKEYRRGRIGIRLFQYAESVLKGIGVNRIILGTKVHLDNSRLFEYLKYKHTDKVFTKIISTESAT